MSRIVRLSFLVLFAVSSISAAYGQSTVSGAIGGSVSNPNKEVVPGAAVTVRSTETNKEDSATTDDQGRFRVTNLPPGIYGVTINAAGFGPYSQDRVVVEVGRVTEIDPTLSIGPVQGTVEVTSEAPVINTSQQDFSTNVNQTSIDNLPSNGRRWSNFALLAPGAVPDGPFGLVSFRGISGLLNNNTVDGGDNNQAFFSEERGRTRINYSISQSSIREFQINTSNYSAEYGRAAGGVVNAVTKSGTNEFHGDAFFYLRDERFNARNPSTFQTIILPGGARDIIPLRPEDNRKQFGGTVGGPIIKDRLFFFFSYDQQKRNFPGVAGPSDTAFFSRVDSPNLRARGLTDPQILAGVAYLQSLTGEVLRRGDQTLILPKMDWRINDSNTLTGTYNRLRWNSPAGVQTGAIVTRGRASFGDDLVDVDSLTLRLSSTLSPTLLNEARFQYGRDFERQIAPPPAPGEPTTAPGGASPSVGITGGFTSGKPTFLDRRAFPDEKRWQYADTMTVTRGNHTVKFGADINYVTDVNDNLFTEAGSYFYTTINDFIVDHTNFTSNGALRTAGRLCSTSTRLAGQCYSGTYNQGFGPPRFEFATTDYNFFFQDDWRVSPRLTLNLGLRYEYQKMPEPQIPNAAFDADPRFTAKTSVFPADKNNFGPRFGFAYDLTGDGKTSLRGGYGIYYGRIQNSVISNAITNTGVPTGQIQISTTSAIYPNVFASPGAASGGTSPIPNIVAMASNLANPQIHQMDLVFERQIATNTIFSASALMSLGRRLPTFVDVNLAFPTATTTFNILGGPFGGQTVTVPRFTTRLNNAFNVISEVRSTNKSEYEALVLQLNRRLTKGLQFATSYTFSRATDTGQATGTFTENNVPFNPYDYSFEKGYANFDMRHRYVASAIWQPKFFGEDNKVGRILFNGFSFAPVMFIQSGFPYSIGVDGSVANAVRGGSGFTGSRGGNRLHPLVRRNSERLPRIVNVDMRISRRFRFTETMNLEFLAEAFNIFNRTQVISIDTNAYSISTVGVVNNLNFRPAYQTVSSTQSTTLRERQFQFAIRFQF
ncbi:TonB-dependent receptor [soil metagenome]